MRITKFKKALLVCLAGLVLLQVGTYLLFAESSIPSIALHLTPEYTHFAKGTKFSWVLLEPDSCENLTKGQKADLRSALARRYDPVYAAASDLPDNLVSRDTEGNWTAYKGGFRFGFGVVSRRPFWVRVRHGDLVGNLAASWGTHDYVWILCMWVKIGDGPMLVA